ncbi:PAS domain S-box protein [bacterium]|nr:PAS domain S-box protein [bacterium]
MQLTESIQEKASRIKALMIARLLIVTAMLGIGTFVFRAENIPFYWLISVMFLLTIVYSILLVKKTYLDALIRVQIIADTVWIGVLIYYSGGIDSIFTFLYVISIISGSLLLPLGEGLMLTSFAVITYFAIIVLQYNPEFSTKSVVIYVACFRAIIFYLVSILSGILAKNLRHKTKQLRELQNFTDNILQNMASGLITVDSNGMISYFNQAASDILGYQREEAVGTAWKTLFPGTRIKIENYISSLQFGANVQKKNGDLLPVGFSVSPLKTDDGEFEGTIFIFRDLTAIKELERKLNQNDRLALMGKMSAKIAHEVRNPLASLRGSAEMLKEDDKISHSSRKLLELIIRESDKINERVTGFLNLSKPAKPKLKRCSIHETIKNVLVLLRSRSDVNPEINIGYNANNKRLFSLVDADQIERMFLNLCLNAIQAMSEGGTLAIDADIRDEMIEVRFTDTGKGLSADEKKSLFDPFSTTSDKRTGLGLSIVREIIDAHNGQIEVISEKGEGSSFIVKLPVAEV